MADQDNRDHSREEVDDEEVDVFRHTPLRYLGYANEVGEAFRPRIPLGMVIGSYMVASAYVVGDTFDKAHRVYRHDPHNIRHVAVAGADCLVWQGLASVAIPGLVINRTVALSQAVLRRAHVGGGMLAWGPTVVGLATIPFIVHPIDTAVTWAMDRSVRKWVR